MKNWKQVAEEFWTDIEHLGFGKEQFSVDKEFFDKKIAGIVDEARKSIIMELKADLWDAEQDKEMAEDPMDPKVRIVWFKHKLDQKLNAIK